MATLHIIRTSAFVDNQLALCCNTMKHEDAIVLLDDGIYNLKHSLVETQRPNTIYTVASHAKARGIAVNEFDGITLITIEQLVSLTCEFEVSITWQ